MKGVVWSWHQEGLEGGMPGRELAAIHGGERGGGSWLVLTFSGSGWVIQTEKGGLGG